MPSLIEATPEHLSRRRFLGAGGAAAAGAVAAACAPAAAPAPAAPGAGAPAQAAWEREWQDLVAAAKKEEKVNILTFTGAGYRKSLDAFEQAFPGITVGHQASASASVWIQKLKQEREAGVYDLDLFVGPPNSALVQLKPERVWEPVRPLIFRPDITEERLWRDGFSKRFLDTERQLAFGWEFRGTRSVNINTDMVKEEEVKTIQDLLNPKWKGKIIMADVRLGDTYLAMTALRKLAGDDAVKRLLIDQEPVFSRDPRQIVEGIVRGRYPIALGLRADVLREFTDQGLGKNVKALMVPGLLWSNSFSVLLVNRAPHPVAAKLFVNWFLTREGQDVFRVNVPTNSARTDVEPGDPSQAPVSGVNYYDTSDEANYGEASETQKYINGLVGITN